VVMDLYEAIKSRYSVRSYLNKPVEKEKLDRILDAARLAPSGSNRQPWKFVIVRDAEMRKKLVRACSDQTFVGQAPIVIAAVGLMPDRIMSCGVPGDPVDVAIALEHVALAATAERLGTCWIGSFHQDQIRTLLRIPANTKVIEVMTLGYPADRLRPKTRKSMKELVCYDQWR
jgi:nitroreductase